MKKRTQIKICGLTNLEDAKAALEAGADFLGFVVYAKSPRGISATALRRIVDQITGKPKIIGVFVNKARAEVLRIVSDCGLYAVQLHGDEPVGDFVSMPVLVWRAVRVRQGRAVPLPEQWPAARYVVDADVSGQYGGTGTEADWPAAAGLSKRFPVMLAGGLLPDNVEQAIRIVQPTGVDVASGVEKKPGKKDYHKLKAFIAAVRKNSH